MSWPKQSKKTEYRFINIFSTDTHGNGRLVHHVDPCPHGNTHATACRSANSNRCAKANGTADQDYTYSMDSIDYLNEFKAAWLPFETPRMKSLHYQVTNERLTPERFRTYDRYLREAYGVSQEINSHITAFCMMCHDRGQRVSRQQRLRHIRLVNIKVEKTLEVLDQQLDWEIKDVKKAEAESLMRRLVSRRSRRWDQV